VPAHPLGRIVIGTKRPLNREGRRMALEVRQFLHNQHVQPLLETYTDWLAVGPIDEIVAFEPDPDAEDGFRILIASPARFRALLQELPADAVFFSGRVRIRRDPRTGREVGRTDARETAAELLAREDLWAFNERCAEHLAEVRADLRQGLGLDDSAFHEVPVAFRDEDGALAYFPDMVNHLVLGPVSIVPRPYGPSVGGTDALEEAFLTAAGPTRDVRFVDDWILYHEASGEIHCGTNVRRRPDLRTRWWETRPPTVYDAAIRR
jgi:protein-arginine deiminase